MVLRIGLAVLCQLGLCWPALPGRPHPLLTDPAARYTDLGSDFYDTRINPERRKRNHIRQLEALGYKVTLEPAAA